MDGTGFQVLGFRVQLGDEMAAKIMGGTPANRK
jgi:hypothetical protein